MVTIKKSHFVAFVILCTLLIGLPIVYAWTGPGSAPPNGNVSAPVHVGAGDQIKAAGLGVNSLAVYGNAILSSVGAYLNFGTIAGSAGYGFRDNAGVMEVKNSGDSWARFATTTATGFSEIKFTDGTTQTSAASPKPDVFFRVVHSGNNSGADPRKVDFTSEQYDTTNAFNLTTDRFQPTVAGKYLFTMDIQADYSGAGGSAGMLCSLYKNGINESHQTLRYPGSGNTIACSISTILYLNGTTDYVEGWVYDSNEFYYDGSMSGILLTAN
jgi:hypothetical protein